MHGIISCKKYAARTLKLVDVGDMTKEKALETLGKYQGMECPICGPCSHVELSFRNHFTIHGDLYETQDEATVAMWELYDSRPVDFRCEGPPRIEHEHEWGPVEHSLFTGNPHRKCQHPGCREITMDLEEEAVEI